MGLFLIVGPWPKILSQNSKGPAKCVYCVCVLCMVYTISPFWLKCVPGWPTISVSS